MVIYSSGSESHKTLSCNSVPFARQLPLTSLLLLAFTLVFRLLVELIQLYIPSQGVR